MNEILNGFLRGAGSKLGQHLVDLLMADSSKTGIRRDLAIFIESFEMAVIIGRALRDDGHHITPMDVVRIGGSLNGCLPVSLGAINGEPSNRANHDFDALLQMCGLTEKQFLNALESALEK